MSDYNDAITELDTAITKVCQLTDAHEDGEFITGWVVIVNGVRYMSPEKDDDFEPGDEDRMIGLSTPFVPVGQNPTLTRGIVEGFLDRLRQGIG